MTLLEVGLLVLEAHEARSIADRALEEFYPLGATIVVRVDGEETEWQVEDIDFERLRVKACRETGGARPVRASFGVSDILRLKP